MPTEVILPECLMQSYRFLFPNLDFAKVRFFDGLPWYIPSNREGYTVPDSLDTSRLFLGRSRINVSLSTYDPCSMDTFILIAHELVHAQQIQDAGNGLGLFHNFTLNYLTCYFATGSAGRDHPYEREAYDYAGGTSPLGVLDSCMMALQSPPPCDCSQFPWPPLETPGFQTALRNAVTSGTCPDIVKSESTATAEECLRLPNRAWYVDLAIRVVSVAIVIVLAIVAAISEFVEWLTDFFDPEYQAPRMILMFSSDKGDSYGNKIEFAASERPPALAAGQTPAGDNHLFIGWTGTDQRLNVLAAPGGHHVQLPEESGYEPGLGVAFSRVFLSWLDRSAGLLPKVRSSPLGGPSGPAFNGLNFLPTPTNPATGAPEQGIGPPSLADGDTRLYAAERWENRFPRGGKPIFVASSPNGLNWTLLTSGDPAFVTAGPAIAFADSAVAFGVSRLFLAWTDARIPRVHLRIHDIQPNGSLAELLTAILPTEPVHVDAAPAIAFGDGRLFVAWTTNAGGRVNVMYKDIEPDDFTDVQRWQRFEQAQPPLPGWKPQQKQTLGNGMNTRGPALAYMPGGAVYVGWLDSG